MNGRRVVLPVAVGLIALAGVSLAVSGLQEEPFPHEEHQGLFPVCTGCHEGIALDDPASAYPPPASCVECHDGVLEGRVSWAGPSERVDNLTYEHRLHEEELAEAGDPPLQCSVCHIPEGGGRLAVVEPIQVGTCWGCHAHPAEQHYIDADCASCHVPLARTQFDLARIEALPTPSNHEPESFLAVDHGRLVEDEPANCATCHTRERCASCHVDASIASIGSIPPAGPGMELPLWVARYDTPASHASSDFAETHGTGSGREACATCHTRNDCMTCHVAPLPASIASLPAQDEVVAPGVLLVAAAPGNHESLFFMQAHPTLAASDAASCATCHEESYCVTCHDAPVGRGYHPADFVSRHTAAAFGRAAECSSCHSAERFCRECHVEMGLVARGRLGPGYHNATPVWLIRHGQAARQNLESCAGCHRQNDCTQCHGVLGAFKVSPHTGAFDAQRAWARSPRTCLACHVGNPLNGN